MQIKKADNCKFQSTQPEWAATFTRRARLLRKTVFQSTQPEWAATNACIYAGEALTISIHAARVGCDKVEDRSIWAICISIHAARVGCDLKPMSKCKSLSAYFNPRSPSGLRLNRLWQDALVQPFQSTQPEWAATREPGQMGDYRQHFNPRSPSGLRQKQ